MNTRELLEDFRTGQSGIDHLVYGDLTTSMVLFAASEMPLPQEAHDGLAARGVAALTSAPDAVAGLAGMHSGGLQISVANQNGFELYVQSETTAEEALFLKMQIGSDPVATADAAARLLTQLAAD